LPTFTHCLFGNNTATNITYGNDITINTLYYKDNDDFLLLSCSLSPSPQITTYSPSDIISIAECENDTIDYNQYKLPQINCGGFFDNGNCISKVNSILLNTECTWIPFDSSSSSPLFSSLSNDDSDLDFLGRCYLKSFVNCGIFLEEELCSSFNSSSDIIIDGCYWDAEASLCKSNSNNNDDDDNKSNNDDSSKGGIYLPFWLLIVIIAVGATIIIVLLIIVVVYVRKAHNNRADYASFSGYKLDSGNEFHSFYIYFIIYFFFFFFFNINRIIQ
jgi:hypothetical protein